MHKPMSCAGDILFLYMGSAPFRVGEIVVYKVKGRDIPIVHRIIEVHDRPDGEQEILTKGDNNDVDDRLGGLLRLRHCSLVSSLTKTPHACCSDKDHHVHSCTCLPAYLSLSCTS